jgi:hypothetical protein
MRPIIRPGHDSQYGGCAHVFVTDDIGSPRHVADFYAPTVRQAMVLAQHYFDIMDDVERLVQRTIAFGSSLDGPAA